MENQPRDPSATSSPKGGSTGIGGKSTDRPPPSSVVSSRLKPVSKSARTTDEEMPTFSDFEIIKKLGEGAMGAVYKGRQISTGREVAIKVMLPHIAKNPKVVERFYREARSMGLIDHPNIIQCYAVDEDNGCHYFAMEYVEGRSLQDWLKELGKFPLKDALYVAIEAAKGLQYAHELGLIHRDIKPANIMITKTGGIKIADFGMVKQLDDDISVTQTGQGIGTPAYMPLEQARNAKDADARSDVYALGCTLYCLLTGQPPYMGGTIVELIQAQEKAIYTPARKYNREVPERLDLIMGKMIAKLVKYRYQTCADVVKDLEGLGLANKALSFIPGAAGPAAAGPDTAGAKADTTATGWYFVRYKGTDGEEVTRKLTPAQIREMIKEGKIDQTAEASRHEYADFVPLVAVQEFDTAFQTKRGKKPLNLKDFGFKSLDKVVMEPGGPGRLGDGGGPGALRERRQTDADRPAPVGDANLQTLYKEVEKPKGAGQALVGGIKSLFDTTQKIVYVLAFVVSASVLAWWTFHKPPVIKATQEQAIAFIQARGGTFEWENPRVPGGDVVTVNLFRGQEDMEKGTKVIKDYELGYLRAFPHLRKLKLGAFFPDRVSRKITDKGLAEIAGLTELQELNLMGTGITDKGLAHLSKMKDLDNLDVGFTYVTDPGVKSLLQFDNLKKLGISGIPEKDISDATLEQLRQNAQIHHHPLDIDGRQNSTQ